MELINPDCIIPVTTRATINKRINTLFRFGKLKPCFKAIAIIIPDSITAKHIYREMVFTKYNSRINNISQD